MVFLKMEWRRRGEAGKQRDVGGNAVCMHGHIRISMHKLEIRSVANRIAQGLNPPVSVSAEYESILIWGCSPY